MFAHLVVAALLASNADGKSLVRAQQGTLVPSVSSRKLLITDDLSTVCHAWWDGAQIQDTKGCAWVMQGTVPQVQRNAKTPAGSGQPFTASNYYKLGTGNDVLDFTGNFSVCMVYKVVAGTSSEAVVGDGIFGASGVGWGIQASNAAVLIDDYLASSAITRASDATAAIVGAVNVVCGGRSGTTHMVKSNLRTAVTTVGTVASPATATVATIGWVQPTGAGTETVLEVWFSSAAASDAAFTAIEQQVRLRAGVTAW